MAVRICDTFSLPGHSSRIGADLQACFSLVSEYSCKHIERDRTFCPSLGAAMYICVNPTREHLEREGSKALYVS